MNAVRKETSTFCPVQQVQESIWVRGSHSGGYGEYYILGYDAEQSSVCCRLYASFLLDLLFDPEDGGDMFLRNVGRLSADYRGNEIGKGLISNLGRNTD
jgi:hypothetical protein